MDIIASHYALALTTEELAARGVVMRLKACRQHMHRPRWPFRERGRPLTGYCDMPNCDEVPVVDLVGLRGG
jgi:hypothetical protein